MVYLKFFLIVLMISSIFGLESDRGNVSNKLAQENSNNEDKQNQNSIEKQHEALQQLEKYPRLHTRHDLLRMPKKLCKFQHEYLRDIAKQIQKIVVKAIIVLINLQDQILCSSAEKIKLEIPVPAAIASIIHLFTLSKPQRSKLHCTKIVKTEME